MNKKNESEKNSKKNQGQNRQKSSTNLAIGTVERADSIAIMATKTILKHL